MKAKYMLILIVLALTSCGPMNLEASQTPTQETGTFTAEPTIQQTPAIILPAATATQTITVSPTATTVPPLPFTWQGQVNIDCLPGKSWSWDITVPCNELRLRPVFYTGTSDQFYHAIHNPTVPSIGIVPIQETTSFVFLCGSGWWDRKDRMPCEKLRTLLEGEAGYQPGSDFEECGERCTSINNLAVTISDNTAEMQFTVSRVVTISGEIREEYDTSDVSAFFRKYFPESETSSLIFLVFCGWGPEGVSHRYEYTRYILVLAPQEPAP